MSVLSILSIFIFIIVLVIFIEYRNEKKYQKTREEQRQTPSHTKDTTPPQKVEETPKPKAEPVIEAKPEIKTQPEPEVKEEPKPEPELQIEPQIEPEIEIETVKEAKELPEANYPQFTHVRLVEMGLSDEEAKEFVAELIPQIEVEIPQIEAAIEAGDFDQMERITHGIKGSATNLGTGGVSDLLSDFNTYLKSGTDKDVSKAYLKHLIHYTNELKTQYT